MRSYPESVRRGARVTLTFGIVGVCGACNVSVFCHTLIVFHLIESISHSFPPLNVGLKMGDMQSRN